MQLRSINMKYFNPILLILLLIAESVLSDCDAKLKECSETAEESNIIHKGIPWQEFYWQSYIQLDWDDKLDTADPVTRFGINLKKSIDLGVSRKIPKNRPVECDSVDWERSGTLPTTSVIITYRDEPRSTLLRTIVSVFERSPEHLIKEIILVDDNNDDETIGTALKVLDKVIVLRNDKREGLIRSRIKGTNLATGDVLVFLDSHCECEEGWLEPLLERIAVNPKTVACPVIENINLYDYNIEPVSSYLRGGFNWNLEFFWEYLPARDRARRLRDPTYSFETPAIAGGLFAIDRKWFLELGTYDNGMEIWGGENIEFSLRAWTCGGKMEIVPCSKVGHIYKKRNVYSYPKGHKETRICNNRRVAAVWLDNFEAIHNSTLSEVPKETDQAFGQIHFNQPSFLTCLDALASGEETSVGANSCIQSYHPQQYRMTKEGLIQQDDFCLQLTEIKSGAIIISELCDPDNSLQKFKRYRPKSKAAKRALKEDGVKGYQIRHHKHDLCLDTSQIKQAGLRAFRCSETEEKQRFLFAYANVKV